ncbi:MAG: hypothetical protein JWO19_5173 [Bryobacterales bacterium]|nr:hypothetical protein [Bryobacterales bacterium]
MTPEPILTIQALSALQDEWTALYERVPDAAPFQHPGWLLPWWEKFGSGELISFGVRHEDRLVAMAPLFLHVWLGRRQVTFLGNGVSDRLEFLAEPCWRDAAIRMVLQCLAGERNRWDVCDLQDLPPSFSLPCPPPDGVQHLVSSSSVCSHSVLPPTREEFERALPHRFSRNLRRCREELNLAGEVEFQNVQSDAEFGIALDALFALRSARWETRAPDVSLSGKIEAFHRDAAGRLWKAGKVRLFLLLVDKRPVAALYGFLDKQRFSYYFSGFDPCWSRFSPGSLLLKYAIAQSIEEGARRFDFLRGDEPYKREWGARFDLNLRLLLWHRETPVDTLPAT